MRDGLIHPGDENKQPSPIVLPIFRTAGMPPEMKKLVDETSKLLGEAIVHLIETEGGCELVDRDAVTAMRDSAAPTRVIGVHCRCDKTNPLFILTVGEDSRVYIDGASFVQGISRLVKECPHR